MTTDHLPDYSLAQLIGDLTSVVEQFEHDADRVGAAEDLVARLMTRNDWLPEEQRRPASEGYARYSLYIDPQDRFEILALVWKPGQRTPIHDHDTTWGVEGVLTGRMKATNFILQASELPGHVRLRPIGEMILDAGETGELLPPADCHILESQGDDPTITIHVYGKQLKRFNVLEPTEEAGVYSIHLKEIVYSATK